MLGDKCCGKGKPRVGLAGLEVLKFKQGGQAGLTEREASFAHVSKDLKEVQGSGGKQSRPEGEARAEALRVESAGVSEGLSTAVFLKLEPTSEDTWRATAGSQPQGRRLASHIPMGGNAHVRMQNSVSVDMSIGYCGTLRWGRPRGVGTPQWHSVLCSGDRELTGK